MEDKFRAYEMSVETCERFFRLCNLWNLKTYDERMALMQMMIHTDNIKILTDKMLKKRLEGKKVLGIEHKESGDGN